MRYFSVFVTLIYLEILIMVLNERKKIALTGCILSLLMMGQSYAAEKKKLVEQNFDVSTIFAKEFTPPTPVISPSENLVTGERESVLFSVNVYVPGGVSRVTIYPASDKNFGLGELENKDRPGEKITYRITDQNGNKLMHDHGIDVKAYNTYTFKAVQHSPSNSVKPGNYSDELMVGYFVD
ncbi:Cro/Cl family transcriptional regulator [Vibrio parahaemolyticus]|nr:Cro/Cl family transcriptional regulator [Vibrio parahaemolyticus]